MNFCFLQNHESEARTIIAGLVPFIHDTYDPWDMSTFSSEAKLRHQFSRWEPTTRQVFSADEAEISNFLAKDDELNHTNIPTESKTGSTFMNPKVEVNVPIQTDNVAHHLQVDDDSVSTFHQSDNSAPRSHASTVFQPRTIFGSPSVVPPTLHMGTPSHV